MGPNPAPAPKPTPIANSPIAPAPASRPTLDLHSALDSVLRTWLVARDSALWTFVSGVDEPLAQINLRDAESHVGTMNQLRSTALDFARQISEMDERPVKLVMYESIARVLDGVKPKFLLGVEGVEGAF